MLFLAKLFTILFECMHYFDYIFPDKHSKTNLINLIVTMLPLDWFNNAPILLINNAEKECYE